MKSQKKEKKPVFSKKTETISRKRKSSNALILPKELELSSFFFKSKNGKSRPQRKNFAPQKESLKKGKMGKVEKTKKSILKI